MNKITYIPKGGMCATCKRTHDNCSGLKFGDMPMLTKPDENRVIIVKCSSYERGK